MNTSIGVSLSSVLKYFIKLVVKKNRRDSNERYYQPGSWHGAAKNALRKNRLRQIPNLVHRELSSL